MDNETVDKILREAQKLWPRTSPFPDQEKLRSFVFLVLAAANRAGFILLDQERLEQAMKRIINEKEEKT